MVAHSRKTNHILCRRCGKTSLNKTRCVSCNFKKSAKLKKKIKSRKSYA